MWIKYWRYKWTMKFCTLILILAILWSKIYFSRYLQGKNGYTKVSKSLARDIDLRIILLDHQNN